jgi:hypothetical protein
VCDAGRCNVASTTIDLVVIFNFVTCLQ